MPTHPYQQYFEGSPKRGLIRSIRAGHEAAFGLALIYAAIGASLGILSGTAVAMVFPISGQGTTTNLAQASASVSGMSGPLKTAVAQIPIVQSQPAFQAAQMPSTPHATVAVESHVGLKTLMAHSPIVTHKTLFSKGIRVNSDSSKSGMLADKAPAPVSVSSQDVATASVPVAAPVFMIEGDATVADYDATTGLVETHEGKSFSIGTSASISSSWDDYSGHVHYRCDKGGSCTLSRSGVVVPNARMTT